MSNLLEVHEHEFELSSGLIAQEIRQMQLALDQRGTECELDKLLTCPSLSTGILIQRLAWVNLEVRKYELSLVSVGDPGLRSLGPFRRISFVRLA